MKTPLSLFVLLPLILVAVWSLIFPLWLIFYVLGLALILVIISALIPKRHDPIRSAATRTSKLKP